MRLLAMTIAFVCAPQLPAQSVSKVAFSEIQSSVRAFSANGEVILPAVRAQLDISRPGAKIERTNLVVVYDPGTGRYLWRNTTANYSGDSTSFYDELESGRAALYTGAAGLIFFYIPSKLYVQELNERADNVDAAERASIAEIGHRELQGTGHETAMKVVPLYQSIGRGFACDPENDQPNCLFTAKSTVSIGRQGDNWRLVVRNRWDQEIILDSKYNLVSTNQLALPVTPAAPH